MARKAIVHKDAKKKERILRAKAEGRKPKKSTQLTNRCHKCGRIGGYYRKFDLCRICIRELASQGKLMGVKKSSW